MAPKLAIKNLKNRSYREVWQAMVAFTDSRTEKTPDEIWFVEHPPVYTLGQTGRTEHLLTPGDIEVVQTDRGGQVTYHGPGQIVAYLLFDLRRLGIGVRDLVTGIESSVISLLADYGIEAQARREAPGVYVGGVKVAALGLRIRRGCSYHGLSLNVDMDLSPFHGINPCGYPGLEVTDLAHLGVKHSWVEVADDLQRKLTSEFGYHADGSRS